jgi:hypothetical protein
MLSSQHFKKNALNFFSQTIFLLVIQVIFKSTPTILLVFEI